MMIEQINMSTPVRIEADGSGNPIMTAGVDVFNDFCQNAQRHSTNQGLSLEKTKQLIWDHMVSQLKKPDSAHVQHLSMYNQSMVYTLGGALGSHVYQWNYSA